MYILTYSALEVLIKKSSSHRFPGWFILNSLLSYTRPSELKSTMDAYRIVDALTTTLVVATDGGLILSASCKAGIIDLGDEFKLLLGILCIILRRKGRQARRNERQTCIKIIAK